MRESTSTGVVDPGAGTISFRPAEPEDRELLFGVYAATREEELRPVPWTAEQKEAFLRQQFAAQDTWYRGQYPGATFEVIRVDGRDAGRLYLARSAGEVLILDIALLPAERGAGVGSRILRSVQEEARAAGAAVVIHVEKENPARRLYERLGFRVTGDLGVYLAMEWRADAAS